MQKILRTNGERLTAASRIFRIRKDSTEQYIHYDKMWFFVLAFAVVLIAVNSTRLFGNSFWGDEVYSIDVAHRSYSQIIDYAMNSDSHPPLYNMMMHTVCLIFGYTPFAYHFTPMIAYIGIVVLAVTSFYRCFGKYASFMLLVFASVLTSSLYYIPEARMYELGAFFILGSFISFYEIIRFGEKKRYIWFFIFTVLAAYTHYYCLLTVAILYLMLIIDCIVRKKANLKWTVAISVAAVVSYVPWVIFASLRTFQKDVENFWIESTPSFDVCFRYLFHSDVDTVLSCLFIIIAVFVIYIGISKMSRNSGRGKRLKDLDEDTVWMITGLVAVFGTIVLGLVISAVFRPLLVERYLYPVSVVAWALFSVGISKIDLKRTGKAIPAVLTAGILVFGAYSAYTFMDSERIHEEDNTRIICETENIIGDAGVLVTDHGHLWNHVFDYYYPNAEKELICDWHEVKVDSSKHYVVYLSHKANDDDWNIFWDQGYKLDYVTEGTFAKEYYSYVYDVLKA